MAPKPPAVQASLPSTQSIALALAIVRSKPPGTTASDHVLRLRAQLKRGQQNLAEPKRSGYLDLATYWRQRCESAENKCGELERHIVKLERSNQSLDRDDPGGYEETPASPSKRKRGAAPARKPNRGTAPKKSAANAEETMEDDLDFLDGLGKDGEDLTQHLWTFQKLFRQQDSDPRAICSSLVATTNALGRVISVVGKFHDRLSSRTRPKVGSRSLDQDRSEFSCALSACARAFGMVLLGLKSIEEDDSGRRLPGLVIYESVKMLSTALDAIEATAHHAAAAATKSTAEIKKNNSRTPSNTVKESAAARGIAHFLTGLLAYLDKDEPLHQQLFDGFAYVLFERVGKRLFYCTFGRHRSATIEGDIELQPASTRLADIAKQETEALAIKFEVKALIIVLERAMGLAPNHMNPQPAKKNSDRLGRTLSLRTLPSTSKTRLSPLAKDRLQRTLITCMFGEKVEDEFLDVLTMPVKLGPVPNIPKMEDRDVEEWYQRQVWRLVGWDLLTRESEWAR